jgi:S1-C subfamily serine protease
VIEDSPAAAAGIRAGDVLVSVDDRLAGELTPVQLRNLLSVDGATRRLSLERDGRAIQVVLRLRARI